MTYARTKGFSSILTNLTQDVVLDPQEILALYASEAQLERGHSVSFVEFWTRGKIMSQRANKLQRPFLANSIYDINPTPKISTTAARHE